MLLCQDSGWWMKERSKAWFWKFLMSKYVEKHVDRWKKYMRMSPERFFYDIVQVLKPYVTLKTTN